MSINLTGFAQIGNEKIILNQETNSIVGQDRLSDWNQYTFPKNCVSYMDILPSRRPKGKTVIVAKLRENSKKKLESIVEKRFRVKRGIEIEMNQDISDFSYRLPTLSHYSNCS